MDKLSKFVFEVLSNHVNDNIKSENVRKTIATEVEEKWKNYVKEVTLSPDTKKKIEHLKARIANDGIIIPG